MWKNVIFILLFIQSSCSNGDDALKLNQDNLDVPKIKKFEIVDIVFNAEFASEKEVIDKHPNLNYSNLTKNIQKIIIDPRPIYEKSTFVSQDIKTYILLDSTKLISLPLQIHNSGISLGEKKWNYSMQESKMLTKLNFKDSVNVEPQKHLSVTLNVIYNQIKTPYTLTIKDIETKEVVTVSGIWTGVYPIRTESSVNIDAL